MASYGTAHPVGPDSAPLLPHDEEHGTSPSTPHLPPSRHRSPWRTLALSAAAAIVVGATFAYTGSARDAAGTVNDMGVLMASRARDAGDVNVPTDDDLDSESATKKHHHHHHHHHHSGDDDGDDDGGDDDTTDDDTTHHHHHHHHDHNHTDAPSYMPTEWSMPVRSPTAAPAKVGTPWPTTIPTYGPTPVPTSSPSLITAGPSAGPVASPTAGPTADPVSSPTAGPTADPVVSPTAKPTHYPSPTNKPSHYPSPTASPGGGGHRSHQHHGPTPEPTTSSSVLHGDRTIEDLVAHYQVGRGRGEGGSELGGGGEREGGALT